jgi:pyruvyltransferase
MLIEKIKNLPRKTRNTAVALFDDDYLVMRWATEGVVSVNWGDKLNPYLATAITGKKILHRADVYPLPSHPIHYWIGSHLATACTDPNAIVWGAGFISYTVPIEGRPREIHAVRGWLSADRLQQAGIEAPDVVGDAALLLPRFYTPKTTERRYSLGIIPHCFEWDEPFFVEARKWKDSLMIDITAGIEEVVDQINACDRIISSSLHGIICADSYGIPSLWLQASEKPAGDGFKFRDYFTSVGRADWDPVSVCAGTRRAEVESRFTDYRIDIDLDALWNACPLKGHARPTATE